MIGPNRVTHSVRTALVTACLLLGSALPPAHAQSDGAMLELLRVLHARGSLTDQEYALIRAAAQQDAAARDAEASETASAVEEIRTVVAQQPEIRTDGRLQFTSADGASSIRLGGRLHYDSTWWDDEGSNQESGHEFRRARLYASGSMNEVWDWKFQFDFTDADAAPQESIEDAYVRYSGFDNFDITVGQQKAPFSLSEMTSSKYMTFIERSVVTEATSGIAANRRAGLHFSSHFADSVTVSGALTGNRITNGLDFNGEYAVTGRVTWSPLHEGDQAIHLGVAGGWRALDAGLRVRARPETHVAVRPVDNDFVPGDDVSILGLEGAWVNGPFSVQGEWVAFDLDEANGVQGSGDGSGWYLQSSWFLTGENRRYDWKSGAFKAARVASPVGAGGRGAWELAARFSNLDLDDAASLGLGNDGGGEIDQLTLGVNWYVNNNMMFRLNWSKTLDCSDTCEQGYGGAVRAEPSSITLRSQVFF